MPPQPEGPVHVHGVQEEYLYLMVHPCACGGPWQSGAQQVDDPGPQVVHRVAARCFRCGAERVFNFLLDAPAGAAGPIRQVNPTGEASRAIDLAEWMGLARFYLGRIARLGEAVEKAQSLLDARQCLEEALKFYGPGDDGPPPAALWSDTSRAQAAAQADAFRRETIEKMLARIPPMDRLRQADGPDQKEFEAQVRDAARARTARRWWEFWKRGRPS